MKVGIRYIVTKRSNDTSFLVGDHFTLQKNGTILCPEAQGWMEAEAVPDATKGMEYRIDRQWVQQRKQVLEQELQQLQQESEYAVTD